MFREGCLANSATGDVEVQTVLENLLVLPTFSKCLLPSFDDDDRRSHRRRKDTYIFSISSILM
ncbi:hypothetical protein ACLOJK_029112 [Asimina triloba]